jgi:hypothetical protein
VLRNGRIELLLAEHDQLRKGTGFILCHQQRIADDIGDKYSG